LTISARLVELLGGRIWVESEVGRGSVFHFTVRLGLRKGSPVRQLHGKPANPEGLRLLLVEGSAVNRKIAVGMLEKRGHAVVAAVNGKEALAVLEAGGESPFDLVLMDVQMPEMDGMEATACIREKEKADGRHIPIIAMTAHAMKEDREACIKAGMDAYVSKPLNADELVAAMEKLVRSGQESGKEFSSTDDEAAVAFDREKILASVDGDRELLKEVVGMFLEDYPKTMAEIRAAIDGGDPQRLNRAAHSLKGSVGNFGARATFDAAFRLEMMGKDNDIGGATAVYSALAEEMERLEKALEELAGGALCSRK
jgi:CheY-like chemotaxis protein/HPt (histidine-containing phosphotransfer) domain-containing protein